MCIKNMVIMTLEVKELKPMFKHKLKTSKIEQPQKKSRLGKLFAF